MLLYLLVSNTKHSYTIFLLVYKLSNLKNIIAYMDCQCILCILQHFRNILRTVPFNISALLLTQ